MPKFNPVADHALQLVLDDERCHEYIEAQTHALLGRLPLADDKDDDKDWWSAKARAVDELVDAMRRANVSLVRIDVPAELEGEALVEYVRNLEDVSREDGIKFLRQRGIAQRIVADAYGLSITRIAQIEH